MEKVCFKCGEMKPLLEYYKHKAMGDGHLNKCKACTKIDANKHRSDNLDRVKEYDRNRPNKEERAIKQAEYAKTPKGKEVALKSMRKQRQDKAKYRARSMVGNALKSGVLAKPSTCSNCKSECNPHGHHDDYRKPLDVRWLCVRCHTDFHKTVREKQRELEKQGLSDLFDSHKLIKHVAKTYWKNQ